MTGADARARALLEGLFDYAGLFPPAGLDMVETVRNYVSYRAGPHAWMLGRLVVPWSRRSEFLEALGEDETTRPAESDADGRPCPVTLLVPLPDGDGDRQRFRTEYVAFSDAAEGRVDVGALEVKASDPDLLHDLPVTFGFFDELFPGAEVHVEATESCDVKDLLDALAEQRARTGRGAGKLRTGSIVPEEIPSVDDVAWFIHHCAQRDLPWKATAGLHHPLPATRPLTYEPDSPRGAMQGYLGVLLATAWSVDDPTIPAADLHTFLTSPEMQAIDELSPASIRAARTRGCLSIGSCSFVEPVEGAVSLGLLSHSNPTSP